MTNEKKRIDFNLAAAFTLFSGTYNKLIDRGFLYCLPCGAERKVEAMGDVEECPECKDGAYNLFGVEL